MRKVLATLIQIHWTSFARKEGTAIVCIDTVEAQVGFYCMINFELQFIWQLEHFMIISLDNINFKCAYLQAKVLKKLKSFLAILTLTKILKTWKLN